MYNPTDRLEQALGTRSDQRFSDPPVPHLQEFQSVTTNYRTGLAGPSLSWVGEPQALSFPPSSDPAARGRYREGRDGHGLLLGLEQAFVPGKTECNHTWGWLGESLGLWEGVPRLQAPGRVQPLAAGGCWTWPRAHPGEGDVI